MDDRGNENFFLLNSINYTVAVSDKLPDVLVVELRNFSPRSWKSRQSFRALDYRSHNTGSVCGRILSNVFSNGFEILYSTP